MKYTIKQTLLAAMLFAGSYTQAQTLVNPSRPDNLWQSTAGRGINGINTALIDYPDSNKTYAQLAACAYGAVSGTTPQGVRVTDLRYGTFVNIPYPSVWADMSSIPDVILGNDIKTTGPDIYLKMAVGFVNNFSQIEIDFFDIDISAPGIFTVTYNSNVILPYIGTYTTPVGTVHLDVVADDADKMFGLPSCDRFFATFDAISGITADIFGAYGSLTNGSMICNTTDIDTFYHPYDNWEPDVAGIQKKAPNGTEDRAIFTWVNQGGYQIYAFEWTPGILGGTGLITNTVPNVGFDYYEYPRIDANDDHNTNGSATNANFKVVAEYFNFGVGRMDVQSFDMLALGEPISDWIVFGVGGTPNHYAPTVAFGPLNSQYMAVETQNNGFTPGDFVMMTPIDMSLSTNIAPDPATALSYFVVNNTGGSGGGPTEMGITNHTNAVSTPCNNVVDTNLVAWADYDGTNYNIWYKRSGYAPSGTGYGYRTASADAMFNTEPLILTPNPATTSISPNAVGQYDIMNMLGQVVKSGTLYSGRHDIDIASLVQGSYIINFTKEGKAPVTKCFTKN